MDTRDFPLSEELKREILMGVFKPQILLSSENYENYFHHYGVIVNDSILSVLNNSHREITNILALLQTRTRISIEEHLRGRLLPRDQTSAGDKIIEDALKLAVRLLVMVPLSCDFTFGPRVTVSGETDFVWEEGETIKDFLATHFVPQKSLKVDVRLEKIFNARNIEHIAGIEVRWTSNLGDHLRMRDEDTAVEIFYCASFLRLHHNCKNPFPPGFIEETIQTLALILPELDEDVKKWFEESQAKALKRKKRHVDPLARKCGQLKVGERQIDKFDYWQDRLIILKQAFDETEPKDIKQWWIDRRKRVQWYTFWVAVLVLVLTIVFGLIQCIEGGLQVWLAYRSSH